MTNEDDDLKFPDGAEYIWELTLFLMCESVLLRSFLEYLRMAPDPDEIKAERLVHWEKYVGLQFGNPEIDVDAKNMLRTILDAPVDARKEALDRLVAHARSKYFR